MTPCRLTPPLAAITAVALWTVVPLLAQQTRFTSGVESVRVDVLVMAGGRPLTGLTAADFEVRDDGVPQAVNLIATDALPLSVVVALDTSGSLTAERAETLRAASRSLLGKLRGGDAAGLVAFSHAVMQLQSVTEDLALVDAALARLPSGGQTALFDASYAALSLADEAPGRSLLVVLSDGVDTSSWHRSEDVLDAAKRFETVAYTVAAADDEERAAFLRELSRRTGGQMLDVRRNKDLVRTFEEILNEFRHRYLLSFTPTSVPKSGWHTLDVRVKKRGATVRARPGYFRN